MLQPERVDVRSYSLLDLTAVSKGIYIAALYTSSVGGAIGALSANENSQ